MALPQGKTEWPQSLKDFANRTFAACTDANRKAVSEELRALIFRSFQENTINTTDWANVQLDSLKKKTPIKKRLASNALDDLEKREKRAKRFEREQLEHRRQDDALTNAAIATTSLAGRLGATMLDPSDRSSPAPSPSKYNGKSKWIPQTAFADSDMADPNVIDWDEHTVVGTSTKLEKPYLRLTSAPDPRTVRPLSTLQHTLELLKKKWRSEGNYAYICDQFKSMRQDLTVQRIKNDFTVKVYEIHARIALEKGDLGEYNQCQSQLRNLYAYNIPGCAMEFLAYRILYLLHTRNRRDVNALMAELTGEHKAERAVAHALAVRSALATGNYHAFFVLYNEAPNMNAYIMDHFVERERVNALLVMSKVYRPHCPLSFISTELAFTDPSEAHAFLESHGAASYIDPTPAEISAILQGSSKSKKNFVVPFENRNWDAKAAQAGLLKSIEKYRKVDIKGQI